MNFSMPEDMLKPALLMGKGSNMIALTLFYTAIEQFVGLNLDSGKNL